MPRTRSLLLGMALACVAAGAAEPEAPEPKKDEQELERLEAWAERVTYHAESGKFSFTGNVIVIKGDLRVDCTKMDGLVDAKTRQFVKITAVGAVKMVSVATITLGPDGRPVTADAPDAWRATCDEADYDLRQGRMVMKAEQGRQRPRLTRAKGYGEADTIIFLPDKGEYELVGDPVIRGEIPTGPIAGSAKPKETP